MIGHVAPEAALGGPIAIVEEGDTIVIDVDRSALDLDVPADEIARRFEPLVAAARPRYRTGVMAKYAALVGSASEGAVTTGARMTANLRQPMTAGDAVRIREADHGDADLADVRRDRQRDDPGRRRLGRRTALVGRRPTRARRASSPRRDGRPVGAASVGRIYVLPARVRRVLGDVDVLPDVAPPGASATALLDGRLGPCPAARARRRCTIPVSADRPDGDRLPDPPRLPRVRAHQDRAPRAGRSAPARRSTLPRRASALTTLAERPDLVEGVHAVALEAFADIPGGEPPMAAGDLDEFRSARRRPAVDPAGGVHRSRSTTADRSRRRLREPAAQLPGPSRVAWHDMTAVARGLARTRPGRRAQARDHRLGDRRRPRAPRGGQRHGQRCRCAR